MLKDQIESTKLLISSGLVDIDAKEGKSGKTPLYLSAEHNRTAILSILIASGALDKETDYSGYTPYQAATTKQNREIISIFDEQKKDKLPAWLFLMKNTLRSHCDKMFKFSVVFFVVFE